MWWGLNVCLFIYLFVGLLFWCWFYCYYCFCSSILFFCCLFFVNSLHFFIYLRRGLYSCPFLLLLLLFLLLHSISYTLYLFAISFSIPALCPSIYILFYLLCCCWFCVHIQSKYIYIVHIGMIITLIWTHCCSLRRRCRRRGCRFIHIRRVHYTRLCTSVEKRLCFPPWIQRNGEFICIFVYIYIHFCWPDDYIIQANWLWYKHTQSHSLHLTRISIISCTHNKDEQHKKMKNTRTGAKSTRYNGMNKNSNNNNNTHSPLTRNEEKKSVK